MENPSVRIDFFGPQTWIQRWRNIFIICKKSNEMRKITGYRAKWRTIKSFIWYLHMTRCSKKAGSWMYRRSNAQAAAAKNGLVLNISPLPPKKIRKEMYRQMNEVKKAEEEMKRRLPNLYIPFPPTGSQEPQ